MEASTQSLWALLRLNILSFRLLGVLVHVIESRKGMFCPENEWRIINLAIALNVAMGDTAGHTHVRESCSIFQHNNDCHDQMPMFTLKTEVMCQSMR